MNLRIDDIKRRYLEDKTIFDYTFIKDSIWNQFIQRVYEFNFKMFLISVVYEGVSSF